MPRPDRHREPLVAAAATSLRRQGYAGTSVQDVLRAAGATNGSLYHHFPGGKSDLAAAALAAAAERIDGLLDRALASAATPAAAVESWIDALIAELRRDPRDGCPVATPGLEAAGTDEAVRVVAAEAFARWTATLAGALDGDLVRARAALSAIEGALLLDRTSRSTVHLEAVREMVGRIISYEQ